MALFGRRNSDASDVVSVTDASSMGSQKPSLSSRLGSIFRGKKRPLPGTAAYDATSDVSSPTDSDTNGDAMMSGALNGLPPTQPSVKSVTDESFLPPPPTSQQSAPPSQPTSFFSRPPTPFYPHRSEFQPSTPSSQFSQSDFSQLSTPTSTAPSTPNTTAPSTPTSEFPPTNHADSYFSSQNNQSSFGHPRIVPRRWQASSAQTTQTGTLAPSTATTGGGRVGVSMMDPDQQTDKRDGLRVRKDRNGRLEISWDLPKNEPQGATTTFKSSHLDPTTGKEVDTYFELSYIPHKEGSNRGTTVVNITDGPGRAVPLGGGGQQTTGTSYSNTEPTFTQHQVPIPSNSGAPHPAWKSRLMTDLSSIAKDGSDAAYESALSEVIRNRDLATQTLGFTGDDATKTAVQWAQARKTSPSMLDSSVGNAVSESWLEEDAAESVISQIISIVSTDAAPARIVVDENEANDMHLGAWMLRDNHGRKVPEYEIERRMKLLTTNLDDLSEIDDCRGASLKGRLSVAAQTTENPHCNLFRNLDSENRSRIIGCLAGTNPSVSRA